MFIVNTGALNIRFQPIVNKKTRIATLPQGHLVEKISDEPNYPGWWKIKTTLDNVEIIGYVDSHYLISSSTTLSIQALGIIDKLYRKTTTPVKRSEKANYSFCLNEPGQPFRDVSATSNQKVSSLHKIINWLDVEHSKRYEKDKNTYCNIYAFDYCYLANAYLPRVWWYPTAVAQLKSGIKVEPLMGKTIHELNANALNDWFHEFGLSFGWRRTIDLTEFQHQANSGSVCIITAKRRQTNLPGHIVAVVPEPELFRATRKDGFVITPVQSEAGASNQRYHIKNWWHAKEAKQDKFSNFSFWVHD